MCSLLLGLVLLTQSKFPVPQRVKSMTFDAVQELWVYNLHKINRVSEAVSPSEYDIIERLGCNHYRCREHANTEINRLSTRALFWGSLHRDKEISLRCKLEIDRRYKCVYCNGTGSIKGEWDNFNPETGKSVKTAYESDCSECQQSGDFRFYVKFGNEFCVRDIFDDRPIRRW